MAGNLVKETHSGEHAHHTAASVFGGCGVFICSQGMSRGAARKGAALLLFAVRERGRSCFLRGRTV